MVEGIMKLRGASTVVEALINLSVNTVEIGGQKHDVNELSFDVPISGMVYGTLLNYKGALSALGEAVNEDPYKNPPKAPILYIKPVNTFSSHSSAIPVPKDVENLEMGAALGVVIGRTATRVREEVALDYISGYTIVNDVSIPHKSFYRPAIREKARDGFCPIGPWIVKRDAVSNPNELGVRVFVNNELRQENTTANLIRSVEKLLADVTEFMTLYEGDLLLVGVPEKAPHAKVGDKIRIEIDCVGFLENQLVHEEEWMGGRAL
jgi:5-oxopent-3-ene-1,2,5-tricarboxylate decarboxylase / 2-hydroxyhepta-2,4-diene-1,7-dioate isomerase